MADPGAGIRPARASEVADLARIWYDGWREAHETLVPPQLARLRTPESFRERLAAHLGDVRVAMRSDTPVGFCLLQGDELNQLYVARDARGTGAAAALVADAETRLREAGVERAWLACAIGNDRAARFYEKCGWRRTGVVVYHAEVADGTMPLEVWRYEKRLGG